MKAEFRIASILPLFRYAVVPENNDVPGIPFYRLSEAKKFFKEAQTELPWFTCYLLKCRYFPRAVEVLEVYHGRGFN